MEGSFEVKDSFANYIAVLHMNNIAPVFIYKFVPSMSHTETQLIFQLGVRSNLQRRLE